MFSATLSKDIRPVCKKFMQDVNTATNVSLLVVLVVVETVVTVVVAAMVSSVVAALTVGSPAAGVGTSGLRGGVVFGGGLPWCGG